MCLSMTLLPLPLAPMMTRLWPSSIFRSMWSEHDLPAETLGDFAEFDKGHGAVFSTKHALVRKSPGTFPWRCPQK